MGSSVQTNNVFTLVVCVISGVWFHSWRHAGLRRNWTGELRHCQQNEAQENQHCHGCQGKVWKDQCVYGCFTPKYCSNCLACFQRDLLIDEVFLCLFLKGSVGVACVSLLKLSSVQKTAWFKQRVIVWECFCHREWHETWGICNVIYIFTILIGAIILNLSKSTQSATELKLWSLLLMAATKCAHNPTIYIYCTEVSAIFAGGEHGHEGPDILHRQTREFLLSLQHKTSSPDLKLPLPDIAQAIGNEKKEMRRRSRSMDREEEWESDWKGDVASVRLNLVKSPEVTLCSWLRYKPPINK